MISVTRSHQPDSLVGDNMISVLKEVTDWDMPKGEYHIDQNGHLVAYQAPEAELKVFSAPMKQFSKSRRKFKKVREYAN